VYRSTTALRIVARVTVYNFGQVPSEISQQTSPSSMLQETTPRGVPGDVSGRELDIRAVSGLLGGLPHVNRVRIRYCFENDDKIVSKAYCAHAPRTIVLFDA
jgi:hypothetical protein